MCSYSKRRPTQPSLRSRCRCPLPLSSMDFSNASLAMATHHLRQPNMETNSLRRVISSQPRQQRRWSNVHIEAYVTISGRLHPISSRKISRLRSSRFQQWGSSRINPRQPSIDDVSRFLQGLLRKRCNSRESRSGAGGNRTPVHQPLSARDTTIPAVVLSQHRRRVDHLVT